VFYPSSICYWEWCVVLAKAESKFRLTVDEIMSPDLLCASPTKVRWSPDGSQVYFEWRPPSLKEPATFVVTKEGGTPRELSKEEAENVPPPEAEYTEDRRYALFIEDNNLCLVDAASKKRRLTRTEDKKTDAHFTKDGKKVYYTMNNNLFVLSLEDSSLTQATNFQPAKPEAAKTESQKWLEAQQKEIFEAIREKEKQKEKEKKPERKPYYLKQSQSIVDMRLSPDEQLVLFSLKEEQQQAKTAIVPSYVTESGYTEELKPRRKVGDLTDKRTMGIAKQDGEILWVDHGQGERPVNLSFVAWSGDGKKALLQELSADFKDRWFLLLDPETGKTKVIDCLHDDAWVKGGGHDAGWMPDDRSVWFLSERDGYSHLYVFSIDGGQPRQLTRGEFEVSAPRLSKDKTRWLFMSNEGDPGEHNLYTMSLEGGTRTRITHLEGRNDAWLSPDESMLAIVRSYSNKPPELYLQENKPGAEARQVTSTPSEKFKAYPWTAPEIITFTARDGVKVRARLYKPEGLKPGGSAVIFVHGAGYMQNVHKWWSTYTREYMFNHLLMERGYLVLDIDYRGSAGYGRDWRTGIYRHMGGKDLTDHIDGAKYLAEVHGVDPKRIGIYGGSYGGFITLMAMFTAPEVFAAGAALRPVTDWAHYNHEYTGRILNLPQGDEEAYKRSSPIYLAEGLKGHLLICHGMVDTNVHFQDTVRLVQRLIELRKENWEVAVYPFEDHGFKNETSWADEYKRILKLFETNLKS